MPTQRKTIVPDRYEIKKSGTGKGGPWTLYVVTDQDGVQYKSWGKKYKWEDLLGQEVAIEFEEKVQGQFRDNIIIEDSFRSRQRFSSEDIMAKFDVLESLVRELVRRVNYPQAVQSEDLVRPTNLPGGSRIGGADFVGRYDVDPRVPNAGRNQPENVPGNLQQPSPGYASGIGSTPTVNRPTTGPARRAAPVEDDIPVIDENTDF